MKVLSLVVVTALIFGVHSTTYAHEDTEKSRQKRLEVIGKQIDSLKSELSKLGDSLAIHTIPKLKKYFKDFSDLEIDTSLFVNPQKQWLLPFQERVPKNIPDLRGNTLPYLRVIPPESKDNEKVPIPGFPDWRMQKLSSTAL